MFLDEACVDKQFTFSEQIESLDEILENFDETYSNVLSEGILEILKNSDKISEIKRHTKNLLNKHKKQTEYVNKHKNTKEAKIVKSKTDPIIKQKVKYFTSTYKDADFSDEKVKKKFSQDIKDTIKEVFSVDFSDGEGLLEALLITMLVAAVNGLILTILIPFFGPVGAMIITAVFVAPLTEEFAKNYEIRNDNAGNFVFVFNVYEFGSYVLNGTKVIYRIPAIILHYTTMLVQTHIIRDNPKNEKGAYAAGAIIHGIFNFVASMV